MRPAVIARWYRGSLLCLVVLAACAARERRPDTPNTPNTPATFDTPKSCDSCDEWNGARAPFRLFGNSYYVGVSGLAAVMIDTGAGLILLDGGLPQSAPRIVENLRALGHGIEEVKWIGASHAHYDHVGGIAALQRMSGARVAFSPRGAAALRLGNAPPDDPQFGLGAEAMRFPAVASVVELKDGESIKLGSVTLVAHHTPGHTPGGTSWSWRSCEGERCVNIVYADSLNPISAEGFRYGDNPPRVAEFRASIDKQRKLPCDIIVSAHPGFTALFERFAAMQKEPARNAFIDPSACAAYADDAERRLDKRLAEEAETPASAKLP